MFPSGAHHDSLLRTSTPRYDSKLFSSNLLNISVFKYSQNKKYMTHKTWCNIIYFYQHFSVTNLKFSVQYALPVVCMRLELFFFK